MEITESQLDNLVSALEDMSEPRLEFDVRKDYSGRYMFGKECIGFVTSTPVELHGAICALLAEDMAQSNEWEADYGLDWFSLRPQMDSMGLSSILYYTNLTLA